MKENKYNKRLRYRNHPYLMDTMDLKRFFTIMGMTLVTIVLTILLKLNGYSNISKSIDFASILIMASYTLIIRPNIYNGRIKAYYRRSYRRVSRLMNLYLIVISFNISRFIIVNTFKAITLDDIYFPIRDIFHPVATPLMGLSLLIVLYITFFSDRYTTIKEFSDTVNYEMMFNNKNYNDALRYFYIKKDKEYEVKEYDGTYYDYEEELEKIKELENEKRLEKASENNIRREMRDNNDRNKMDEQAKKRL